MNGIFKDSILNGPGTKFFRQNLTVMKGTFVKGAIFGKGMATKYTDSDIKDIEFIIEGDFIANLPHGHCRVEYYNKTIYDDDFTGIEDQAQEGYESRRISQIYEGDMVEGEKNGRGVLINRYSQAAHEMIKHKNIKITESKYIGEFKHDEPHGYGSMLYENGSKFVGYFKRGQRAGLGMEVRQYGEAGQQPIRKGLFEGNHLIGPNWAEDENLRDLGQGLDDEKRLVSNVMSVEDQKRIKENVEYEISKLQLDQEIADVRKQVDSIAQLRY